MTGTASTSNFSMTGGSVPSGSCASDAAHLVAHVLRGDVARTSRARTGRRAMREPSLVMLRSSSMPSMVLTASSITFVTPVSISSTLAPLSVVVTVTIGKSMFGKSRGRGWSTRTARARTSDAMSIVANTGDG
jgi:hypothetical protein